MVAWLAFPFFVLRMTYFSGGYDMTSSASPFVLQYIDLSQQNSVSQKFRGLVGLYVARRIQRESRCYFI